MKRKDFAVMKPYTVTLSDGGRYLWRMRLFQTPLFFAYLHRFDSPDEQGLHDHPWPFMAFVLRGGYWERRLNLRTLEVTERHIRWFNAMPAGGAHYIYRLDRTPTWTLVVGGRRRKTFGFMELTDTGYIWTHYIHGTFTALKKKGLR